MAGATDRRVVVSVHDVAPSHLHELEWLLGRLDAVGARPRVLKVVPCEAAGAVPSALPTLVQLLRREVAAGAEIVLHGLTHRAAGPLRGPLESRVRGRLLAGAAAEFLSVDPGEMARRVEAGRRALAAWGLDAPGFCAPGWLAGSELLPILAEQGFAYYAGMATLWDLRSGRRLWTPWYGYLGAGAAQERLISLVGAALLAASRRLPVVKVFLHPDRAPESPACQRVLCALERLLLSRRPATYGQLLGI